MSLRFNKILGYAMTIPNNQVNEIVNPDGAYASDLPFDLQEYYEFLDKKYSAPATREKKYDAIKSDLETMDPEDPKTYYPSNFVTIFRDEYNDEDQTYLIVTPISVASEWRRSDDSIDTYEQAYLYRNENDVDYSPTIKFFDHGLFPYEGNFLNFRTGKRIDSLLYRKIETSINDPRDSKNLQELFTQAEVSDIKDFKNVVHPAAPINAIDIAEYLRIFIFNDLAIRLRPALLTFWS